MVAAEVTQARCPTGTVSVITVMPAHAPKYGCCPYLFMCREIRPELFFLVQLQGPSIMPFTLEKENLILGLWQLQQAGQDFRIKEVML